MEEDGLERKLCPFMSYRTEVTAPIECREDRCMAWGKVLEKDNWDIDPPMGCRLIS